MSERTPLRYIESNLRSSAPILWPNSLDLPVPPELSIPKTYRNPILPEGADPWIIRDGGSYYYVHVQHNGPVDGAVYVRKSATITGMKQAESVAAIHTDNMVNPALWAPELHKLPVSVEGGIQDRWYIYVSEADLSGQDRRVCVYEAQTDDPQGPYSKKGKIIGENEGWAIDGTVFIHPKWGLYYIWSGADCELPYFQQNLYIAKMQNPWTLSGREVCISRPQFDWERVGPDPVNEGAAVVARNGLVHVIYSASHSLTDDYCLGRLTLPKDADPLIVDNWQKASEPVFCKTEKVYGPGHPSFTKSPDGKEDLIVYHSSRKAGSGWQRQVNVQPFTWDAADQPYFGRPVDSAQPIPLPSGEYEVLTNELANQRLLYYSPQVPKNVNSN